MPNGVDICYCAVLWVDVVVIYWSADCLYLAIVMCANKLLTRTWQQQPQLLRLRLVAHPD